MSRPRIGRPTERPSILPIDVGARQADIGEKVVIELAKMSPVDDTLPISPR